MPSEKILEQKKKEVERLSEKLKNAVSGVIIDYKGITVTEDIKLRTEFRNQSVDYAVIKNSLLRFAVDNAQLSDLKEVLKGTTALATSDSDVIAPARVIANFIKKNAKTQIKAGFYDGKIVDVDTVMALSKIPSKETLIAKMLGSFNAPITSLAIALDQIAKQKESQAS